MKPFKFAPRANRRSYFAVPAPAAATPVLCGPLYPAKAGLPRFVVPTLALVAGVALFTAAPSARAATEYWEPTGTTGTNASGTWTTATTTLNWNTDSTGAATPLTYWTNGNAAVFSADPGATALSAVTLAGATLTPTSITFGNSGLGSASGGAAGGYTFSNGETIDFGALDQTAGTTYTVLTMNAGVGPVTFNGSISIAQANSSPVTSNFANNSSSLLTFNGAILNDGGSGGSSILAVTGTGSGGVTFSGALQNNGNNIGGRATALLINTTGTGATAITTLGGGTGNIFSGGTTLTSGVLAFTAANSLGSSGSVLGAGALSMGAAGQMNLSGFSQSIGAFSGVAGALVYNNSNTSATLTVGTNNNGGGTYAGVLEDNSNSGATTGTLGLTKLGTTTITLTGANTYSGATSITGGGGGLYLSGAGTLSNTSSITVGAAGQATSTLTYDNSTTGTGTTARLNPSAGLTLNGGTFAYKGVTATVGTNIAGSGASGAISLGGGQTSLFSFTAAAGTGNTSTFTIPSITQGTNATLSANLASANLSTDRIVVNTALTLINGILPWAVEATNVNFLTDISTGSTGFYIGAYGNLTGTEVTTFDNVATSNVKISASQAALTANTSENSLVYAAGATQGLGGHTLTLTSGGLILNNSSAVLGSAVNDGSITTAAANPILYVNANANGTINSAITDATGPATSVALTKFGGSTLTLAGTNTYTGPTTVEQGGLTVAAGGTINSASAVTIQGGATLTNDGTVGGAITENGALTIAGTGAVTTGNISGSGSTGVINYTNTLAGGNTLNFSGTNSFSELNNAAAGGLLTLTGAGSVNTFALFPEANQGLTTTSTTFASGTYIFTAGGSNVYANNLGTFNVAGANVTFTNGLRFAEGGGGTVTVSGGLLQTFTNFDTNQQASGTTINYNVTGGVFDVATSGANIGNEGNKTAATVSSLTVSSTGLFQVGVTSSTSTQNITIGSSAATDVVATVALQAGGTIRDNGTIQSAGAPGTGSTFNFNWTGGTLTAGTVNMANLTDNDGITTTPVAGTLYNGGGTLAPGYFGQTLGSAFGSANAQFTGKTTITGNYQVDSANAALAVNLGGTSASGGFGTAASLYDNVAVSGTAVIGGRLNVGLINAFTPTSVNTFTILTTGNTTKTVNSLTGTFTNTEIGKAATPTDIVVGSSGLNSMSVTYNAGTASVLGSVVLGNYTVGNTYTGATGSSWDAAAAANWSVFDPGSTSAPATVASGAVAQFADGAGTGTGTNAVTLNSTRNIQGIQFSSATAGHNYTISNGGSGAIILDNTANGTVATINDTSASGNSNAINVPITLNSPLAVSVGNAANTLTIGGVVSGSNMMVSKTGAGTLTLTGANTYTGMTNVMTGTMLVNGSIGAAGTPADAVTVLSGATLGGANTGTAGTGILTVASAAIAGTLAPGATIGATTGALTLNTTSGLTLTGTLQIGITSSGGTTLVTSGALGLGAASILNVTGTAGASAYDIANYGSETGTFATTSIPTGYTLNYAGTTFNPGGDIELDMTAVPEPSTWVGALLLTLGALGIKFRRKVRIG